MPLPAILLLCATLLPLLAFALLVTCGRRLGAPLAGVAGTFLIAVSFACSLSAMIFWITGGGDAGWGMERMPIEFTTHWLPIAPGRWLSVGLYIDSLTIVMVSTVTLVATIVHAFSIGYLRGEPRFATFFALLGLFCFAMLALVLSAGLLQVYVFWELVGLCSYLLIGFWYQRRKAAAAATKAFLVNRVGDLLMLIGIGLLLTRVSDLLWPTLWTSFSPADGERWLTIAGVCVMFGAIGKSAQFPLQAWLPDAMEGPSPVSALIHAATMVAAGVYLVARLFPMLTPDAKLFIAIIGCATLVYGGLCAMAQSDIKRVLAYSTISQLGYMMLALGIGSWVGGLFHLITHAFFKSLLFLAAGSVIHATHHRQDLASFGGLWRKMPITAIIFGIGVLAIAGAGFDDVGFSGFYSKQMILTHAAAFGNLAVATGGSKLYATLFWFPAGVSYLTAFYMGRCWVLTFLGTPRDQRVLAAAHESPTLWVPLAVLATLSIVGGKALSIVELLSANLSETRHICDLEGVKLKFQDSSWPARPPVAAAESDLLDRAPLRPLTESQTAHVHAIEQERAAMAGGWGWLIALAIAWALYRRGFGLTERITRVRPIGAVARWLHNGMYFDELYEFVFAGALRGVAIATQAFDRSVIDAAVGSIARFTRGVATGIDAADRYVVDGAVNSVATAARQLGSLARRPDVGRVRVYVTVMMTAAAVVLAAGTIVLLIR